VNKLFIFLLLLILLGSCSSYDYSKSSSETINPEIAQDDYSYYLNIMESAYSEFYRISMKLSNSHGTGDDVKEAYFRSQEIVAMLKNTSVPIKLTNLINKLINGIDKQSTGFGCFSNKSLCNGDIEAMILITEGRASLDDFLNEFDNF
jgi:hypothetical protein